MYICDKCGKTIENKDIKFDFEYWNLSEESCYSKKVIHMRDCSCGGNYEEAKECEKCGKYIMESDRCICESCANDYRTLDMVLEIGSDWEEKLSLNGFLFSAFTKEEIELILIDTLKNNDKEKMESAIKDFCDYDLDNFWGYAEKKWKEEK